MLQTKLENNLALSEIEHAHPYGPAILRLGRDAFAYVYHKTQTRILIAVLFMIEKKTIVLINNEKQILRRTYTINHFL